MIGMEYLSRIILVTLLMVCFSPMQTTAQNPNPTEILQQYQYKTLKDAYLAQGVTVEVTPKNPGPFTDAIIKVTSFGVDLNTSFFLWKVNGETKQSGRGENEFKFKTGKLNERITITITITHADGGNFTRAVNLGVADVDLLWETNSYTPELYKGKALLPLRGSLHVVAIPHILYQNGEKVPDNELTFTWSESGTILGSKSGTGKNVLDLTDKPKTGSRNINVSVTNSDKTMRADRTITIPYNSPEILIYEESPFLGPLYNKVIPSTYSRKGNDLALIVEPFFFSVNNSLSKSMELTWYSKGTSLAQGRKVILTAPETGQGKSLIEIKIKSKINPIERAGQTLEVILEKK